MGNKNTNNTKTTNVGPNTQKKRILKTAKEVNNFIDDKKRKEEEKIAKEVDKKRKKEQELNEKRELTLNDDIDDYIEYLIEKITNNNGSHLLDYKDDTYKFPNYPRLIYIGNIHIKKFNDNATKLFYEKFTELGYKFIFEKDSCVITSL